MPHSIETDKYIDTGFVCLVPLAPFHFFTTRVLRRRLYEKFVCSVGNQVFLVEIKFFLAPLLRYMQESIRER